MLCMICNSQSRGAWWFTAVSPGPLADRAGTHHGHRPREAHNFRSVELQESTPESLSLWSCFETSCHHGQTLLPRRDAENKVGRMIARRCRLVLVTTSWPAWLSSRGSVHSGILLQLSEPPSELGLEIFSTLLGHGGVLDKVTGEGSECSVHGTLFARRCFLRYSQERCQAVGLFMIISFASLRL